MLDTRSRLSLLAPFAAFVLSAVVAVALVWQLDQRAREERRAQAFNMASARADLLRHVFEKGLSACYALAALVREGKGTVANFDKVATEMLPFYQGVSELALAPGGVIRDVVPLAGNEKAVGLDLLKNPAQSKEALLARDTGKPVFAGPLKLVQGGTGIVVRFPIFLDDAGGKPAFWGYALVVMRVEDVLKAIDLGELRREGYAYTLWRINPNTGQKQIVDSSTGLDVLDPVESNLKVSNATWVLGVAPVEGWRDAQAIWFRSVLGLIFSALLAYLVKLLLELRTHWAGLESTVARRTAELREREARYRELFEANPQPMWVYDLETLKFLAVNQAAMAHYGYSREEFLAMNIRDIRPPEDLPRLQQRIAQVRVADVRDAGIWRHFRKDGTPIDVEIKSHTLDFDGRRAQIVHINDVTERLRAEQALRESEARFRGLTDMSSDFYWETDAEHRLTQRSTNIRGNLLVYDDWQGRRRWEIPYLAPDAAGWEAHRAVLDAHQPFRNFEFSRHGTDGREHYISISGDPVFDAAGEFRGYRGVGTDITERKAAERALAESEARFRSLTEMSSDFYWESDAEHRLTARGSADKKVSTVSVFQRGAQIGERRWDIPYLSPDAAGWEAHKAVLDAHLPFRHFELSRRGADGTERHISISGDPVFDAAGAFKGYRGVGTDITERKRYEFKLRRLNEELEQRVAERTRELEDANAELEAFSYSVSHDLRAPLRAIQGFSTLLLDHCAGKIDDDGRDMLSRVGAGAAKMGQIIDDLLKLSLISRQEMRIEPVDLSALAREAADELHATEPRRRVEWVIAADVLAQGDPGLLRVVMQNLIGNAWKYSSRRDGARIEFGVETKDGKCCYFVRDNGVGFDMAYADRLFGPFQRLHAEAEFPGSGIGLTTVARILHRHGGEAWAQARAGEGATFYFSLG